MLGHNSANLKVFDISGNNGVKLDFKKARTQGYMGCYIKATEGKGFTNPYFKKQYTAAKAAGLCVGFYHMLRLTNDADVIAQANYFYKQTMAYKNDFVYMCDVEDISEVKGIVVSKAMVTHLVGLFISTFTKLSKKRIGIYSNTAFIMQYLNKSLNIYPLWVAHITAVAPKDNGIWANWTGWQFSWVTPVDGIGTKVDVSEFTHDVINIR